MLAEIKIIYVNCKFNTSHKPYSETIKARNGMAPNNNALTPSWGRMGHYYSV